ncbi:molybdenum cofactor sulfurase-like [Curcuma longa]|uniref:molybdenum cofactor sulfurase-like n=1 Tax=Curcuma longa TaxID=136217 RepID=UPI003D9FB100
MEVQTHCGEISEVCTSSCFPVPLINLFESGNTKPRARATSTRTTRSNFVKLSRGSVFLNTHFTNHESLPSLDEAFQSFIAIYPEYGETHRADHIRGNEFSHLSRQVCLDYTGFSLFSYEQMHPSAPSSSSIPSTSSHLQPPFFSVSYKSASLTSQLRRGNQDIDLESAIRQKIMHFFNILDDEYCMVCTANRTAAFRLLAESYPFHSNKKLFSVYDYESEAVNAMAESAQRRGAKVMSASFSWPSLRIHSASLKEKLRNRKKKRSGLFVFPVQSAITGARYPYLWMNLAKDNGWQVALDACALGPKDLDTLAISLLQPDFIICSFIKVLGENPSGFAGLFVKKSSISTLQSSTIARSIGVVSIDPARMPSQLDDDFSATNLDAECWRNQFEEEIDIPTTKSFSGPLDGKEDISPSITELDPSVRFGKATKVSVIDKKMEILCRGLDHAESLGLILINNRLRCITNWLILALMKLQHPPSETGHSLVRIYGPRVKFDRGPALAFNIFDWKGEKVKPVLVQKLADRSNISLGCGFLSNIRFADKYETEKDEVLESRRSSSEMQVAGKKRGKEMCGINVVNASFSFLTNFEDAYRLWNFVAKFLDADFVDKEKWRYMTLN